MRLDLKSKLASVFFLWVCAFTLDWPVNATLILLAILLRYVVPGFRPTSQRAARSIVAFMSYSTLIVLIVVSLNAVLLPGGDVLLIVGGIGFHESGALFGLRTACRLVLLSLSVLLFFASTPIREFIRFLQGTGFPPQLGLVLLLTLHFLEQLPDRINQIFAAQEARGSPVRANVVSRARAFVSILFPLVLSSISESIDRGQALELRGFLGQGQMPVFENRRSDTSLLTMSLILLSIALIILRILNWLIA